MNSMGKNPAIQAINSLSDRSELDPDSLSAFKGKPIVDPLSYSTDSSAEVSSLRKTSGKFSDRDGGHDSISGTFLKPGYDYSGKYRPQSKEYYFMDSMSKDLLNRYLERSLFVQNYCAVSYIPAKPDAIEKAKLKEMILDLKPKFIPMFNFWGLEYDLLVDELCDQMKKDIDELHSYDPDIIFGAGVMEHVDFPLDAYGNSRMTIPWYVLAEFGYLDSHGNNTHRNARGVITNKFDQELMLYDISYADRVNGDIATVPDISKKETQMWLYYMATRYIDCGCENIQLGDSFLMSVKDREDGYSSLWSVLQRIRIYAKYRNRGLVLMEGRYKVYEEGDGPQTYYFDPPEYRSVSHKRFDRQLLFDLFSSGIPLFQIAGWGYPYSAYPPCDEHEYMPVFLGKVNLIGNSPGGLSPLGWLCKHMPYRLQSDQGQPEFFGGCDVFEPSSQNTYGWDETTWFAKQSEIYRNRIIKYEYYQLKCFDRNAHLTMSGRHKYSWYEDSEKTLIEESTYNAYTGAANQQETIKCIWNHAYSTHPEWVYHNFDVEEVMNGTNNAVKCLTFVGDKKIFYVGTDNYVHGFVFYNGAWLTVSPSYSAEIFFGTPVSSQVKVKSDLVASPDGNWLMYLGEDGEFYRLQITEGDIWRYRYDGVFMRSDGFRLGPIHIGTRRVVSGSLIYPGNQQIYYIEVMSDGTQRVHGFQKSSHEWQAVSPTYSAEITFHQAVIGQYQAAGALIYDNSTFPNRIYYPGTNGYLAYYEVINLIDYRYVACPGNFLLHSQGLKIVGKPGVYRNRIYFAAIYRGDTSSRDSYRIHCLIDNGGGLWNTVSPSYGAQVGIDAQFRAYPSNPEVAVSDDGKLIAYLGRRSFPYAFVYRNIDGVNFWYEDTDPQPHKSGDNSLQFKNGSVFYLSSWNIRNLHQLKYEENYCSNPAIHGLPGT